MNILNPQAQSKYPPSSGMVLIAEPYLDDPGFARTVVLLCEHGDFGTLGFVLNRPSSNTVNMLLPELRLPGVQIFDGGPVQTDTLQIIHKIPQFLSGIEILPGIFWGASYQELASLCTSAHEIRPDDIRLFRGYAGWDFGQLDAEIRQYSWIIAPASRDMIFNVQSRQLWATALKSLGHDFALLTNLPLNPMLN
ncbi:MAG TPA: YqgE/AlgH family protein [Edaphocola sp.]|nr:YqgE/AlgH family protein [Edaphocola sp.]